MKPVVMTLGDVCTKGSSNLAQKDLDGNSGEYEIYGASGLIKKVNFFHQEKPYIAVVKDGAGVGRTMLLPAKTSVIGTMQYIIPNENIDIEYLYYAITYMDLSRYYMGAAIPHIYFKDYCKEKILVPDIDIQKAIAHKFRIIDGLITARQEQLAKLGELIASRFIEMFGDCKDTIALNDLCSIITDGTHQPPKFQKEGIPFIFVSNLSDNKVTYKTEKFISEKTYNQLYERTPIQYGDILLSTVGSYGHPAVVVDKRKFLFQRHIAYLKPKSDLVNSFFLHSAILAPDGQRQIEERVKGIAQKTLNLSEIRKIKIPIPSIEEQNAFENFIKQIDKSKYLATLYIKLLKNERMMFCDQL